MKSRKVKPAFWTSPDVMNLTPLARLLFIGSWTLADDHGYFEDDAAAIKQALFREDWDVDLLEIDSLIDELLAKGMLARLVAEDGVRLLRVVNLRKHQAIARPIRSRYAVPEAYSDPTPSLAPQTARGAARAAESKVPEDLDPRLLPYVEPVRAILAEVAAASPGATEPSAGAVARALADYPRRDFLPVARNYRAWQLDLAKRKQRQIVRGYRNQLDMAPDVLRPEPAEKRARRVEDDEAKLARLGL